MPTNTVKVQGSQATAPPAGGRRGWGSWLDAVRVYRQPRVLSMLFLGFSSGLPFYLIYQTLSAWLRQDRVAVATIGMLAWAGLAYSLKFLWAPIVDRWQLPLLHGWLGRRRSWMLLAQLGVAAGLASLAASRPQVSQLHVVIASALLAFCAATQDIAIDAWRIESAPDHMQGAMAAAYQLGYRVALITASAGALGLAQGFGWHASYLIMAALVAVGVVTTLVSREPDAIVARTSLLSEARVIEWVERRAHWPAGLRHAGANFIGAVVCPLTDFFSRMGVATAVLLLLLIGSYHFTDYAMGSMVNPFYIDHHYSLEQIATVVKIFGLSVSLIGVVIAGSLIARLGVRAGLVLGSVLIMLSNLGFALLATTSGPTVVGLALANSLDNLALAMQGTALIAFLSSLTSAKYTATQYALLSSFYALCGKILEGTSGFVVHAIGYPPFFVYSASLSIPPLLLLYWLSRRRDPRPSDGTLASA
ncbi:MAG TPA: MFS transporter [Steroidobacteraceae bacterium]|nr:MFS transporter [Steroidobacteraceae bacterium]